VSRLPTVNAAVGFPVSDNIRRYYAVRQHLCHQHPEAPASKRLCGHLRTLAGMVAGIAASGSVSLPKLALKAPDRTKAQSRTKRFERFLRSERTTQETFFEPFARKVAKALCEEGQPLLMVFDSSAVGRGCATLMASVLYEKRALPLAWTVKQGKKGHFCSSDHRALLERVREVVPEEATVIFLGDGEFDSTDLQRALHAYGFEYVCRTSASTLVEERSGEVFPIGSLQPLAGERYMSVPDASLTRRRYGPVQVIVWHEKGYESGVPLVTSLELAEEAIHWYSRRFQIETLFSDQKSRGFHVHKSHISAPERLARLLIAASLAYLWMIYLGAESISGGWYRRFHRTSRVDLGLFQLGLRLLEHLLNRGEKLLVAFSLPPPGPSQIVR